MCPRSPAGPIWARSTFGNISVEVPENMPATVRVRGTALSNINVSDRFRGAGPGVWVTDGYEATDGEGALSVEIESVVGDVHITRCRPGAGVRVKKQPGVL